uniref:Uncharacterized protein n=1 Tax=Physcomitrium patens TaxID=3218 RepID=A0A2K1L7X8_PHYPA|nr:hypothetical protein PHYPA_000574 [Physcomitrium patens]
MYVSSPSPSRGELFERSQNSPDGDSADDGFAFVGSQFVTSGYRDFLLSIGGGAPQAMAPTSRHKSTKIVRWLQNWCPNHRCLTNCVPDSLQFNPQCLCKGRLCEL